MRQLGEIGGGDENSSGDGGEALWGIGLGV